MAKLTFGKELIMDIEESIDEYIFFEYMVAYTKLIEQIKDVDDGMGTTPHAKLMDYLFYKLDEARDDYHKSKLEV
jgi:hypothetical protein